MHLVLPHALDCLSPSASLPCVGFLVLGSHFPSFWLPSLGWKESLLGGIPPAFGMAACIGLPAPFRLHTLRRLFGFGFHLGFPIFLGFPVAPRTQ